MHPPHPLQVANPTEAQEGGRGGGRLYNQEGVISLRRLLTFSPGAFLKRVGGDATVSGRAMQTAPAACGRRRNPGLLCLRMLCSTLSATLAPTLAASAALRPAAFSARRGVSTLSITRSRFWLTTAALQEFEAFRERWLREDFPAWLQRHRPGIEHYRSLTHPLHQARIEAQQQHQ